MDVVDQHIAAAEADVAPLAATPKAEAPHDAALPSQGDAAQTVAVGMWPKAAPIRKPAPKPHAVLALMVALFACVLISLQCAAGAYDNDMWWILATGREIVQNGIPYVNPFSFQADMGIVVQQWLADVILFLIYDAFGITGAQVLVFVQMMALVGCLYVLCQTCRNAGRSGGEISLILIAIGFGAFQAYSSVRPHLYTMIMFALVLLVLEKYRLSKNVKLLVLLPLLVCLHVNLHASMAPYDLFIIALYAIPDVLAWLKKHDEYHGAFSLHLGDYPRRPLLVALVASAAALLVNPYGINGALYLINSYGVAGYGNYINEMGNTSFWTDYGICAMICIVIGAIALGSNAEKRINVPLSLLFVVAIPLSMMHTRNVWLVAFFAVPLAAQAFDRFSLWIENPPELHILPVRLVCCAMLVVATVVYGVSEALPLAQEEYETDSGNVPVEALNYLDEYVADNGLSKADLLLYNSFNNGGYVEWRGYKAFIDPRPELWEPAITGINRHFYQEFVDFAQSKSTTRELLEEYDFDFMIVYSSSDLATDLSKRSDYQVVKTGSGYKLWEKVS